VGAIRLSSGLVEQRLVLNPFAWPLRCVLRAGGFGPGAATSSRNTVDVFGTAVRAPVLLSVGGTVHVTGGGQPVIAVASCDFGGPIMGP
jgi:hypothetical protein